MRDALFPDPEALASICRKHRIRQLSVFGSALKGTAKPNSDLGLLVEFEPHAKPGLIGMAKIEIELSSLLDGRSVDLRTAEDLSRHFRDEVALTATITPHGRWNGRPLEAAPTPVKGAPSAPRNQSPLRPT